MSETILDSGTRRDFGTGALRDMAEGKGRMDLLPWYTITEYMDDRCDVNEKRHWILLNLQNAVLRHSLESSIQKVLVQFIDLAFNGDTYTAILEYAKHMEAGCKKYGDRNWESGIPVSVYLDSALRHFIKYMRGDTDERHDRAMLWNLFCCLWTIRHKPEMIDAPVGGVK